MELNGQRQPPLNVQIPGDLPSRQHIKQEHSAVVQQYLMSHNNNHQHHHQHHHQQENSMTIQQQSRMTGNNVPPSLTDMVNNVMNSMSMDDAADLLLNDASVCTIGMNEQNLNVNNDSGVNSDNSITCAINAAIAVGLAQQQMQQQAQNNEEHVCSDCQEIFKNKVSFNLHRRQKHGDKPHPLNAATPAPPNNTLSPGMSSTNCCSTTQHFSSPTASMVSTAASTSSSEMHCNDIDTSTMMSRAQADMLEREGDPTNPENADGGGKTFTCQYCGELYKSRQSFTRHKNRAHSFTSLLALPTLTPPQTAFAASQLSTVRRKSALAGKTRTVRCGKCEGTVSNQSNLCAHLRDRHGEVAAMIETSKFSSMADFYAWKSEIEKRTKAVYLKRRKKEHGDSRKHYYYCRRSGCFESKANGIRARLSNKVGYHCTGFITACENMKSNEVQVEYCTFHYCQDEQAAVASTGRGGSLVTTSSQKAPKQSFSVKTERQDNHHGTNSSFNSNVELAPSTVTVIPIPLLAEIQQQQQQQQSGINSLQKNLETGNHTQIAGQQQTSNVQRPVQTTLNFCWSDVNNFKAFDSQASLPGKELKVSAGVSADQQQSQNAVPPLQQQQIVMPLLTSSSSGGNNGLPSSSSASSSAPQTQPTKLVAVSGPGGATAYISSVDVGTLYGYELVDQGKIVCHSDDPSSSLTYTTTTGDPVSLFVTGTASQIAIPNMNMDPQHQIHIQIQQQQQQSNRNQRQVVSTENNNHKIHNVPGTSNQQQQQQQNSAFIKETIEYLDCATQNLKLYTNLNVNNDGKKLELLKNIHARSMELFNLTMWINEDERSKRAHAFSTPDESQFGRKSQVFPNFDGYEHKSVIPNAVQQQQQQHPAIQNSSDQPDDEKFVKVTVVSPQNAGHVDEVRFRIRLTTELGKLKKAYAERLGLPIYTLRFVYRNRVIKDEETPQMLKMEAEDVVQVYAEQVA